MIFVFFFSFNSLRYIRFQDGGTPLFVACQYGHIDMVKDLIALGANVHVTMKVNLRDFLFHTNKTRISFSLEF